MNLLRTFHGDFHISFQYLLLTVANFDLTVALDESEEVARIIKNHLLGTTSIYCKSDHVSCSERRPRSASVSSSEIDWIVTSGQTCSFSGTDGAPGDAAVAGSRGYHGEPLSP